MKQSEKIVNFYSVIIGTELLNGRRKDAHFSFLNQELVRRGWRHKASFVIEDEPELMENIYRLIKADKNSVMFSFGGIGSTPDDLTREVAGKVFTNGQMCFHKEAKALIEKQFKQEAYPHRINMAYLPKDSKLLDNVVNNVPGFYLDNRFFFTPGFPSMSQAMVLQALNKYYEKNSVEKYRLSLTAGCGESDLIDIMKQVNSEEVELSSLPRFIDNNKRATVISLSSINKQAVEKYYELFVSYLKQNKIDCFLEDIAKRD
ncbi:molybdopterin-binding protein, CinA family [Malaciobacter halophilus]|uniref:competence/damage-inducible protein A n=1 Tax=Malaciobacter halophilus TaxID=197482 RepID=UPI000E105E0E|nr:molybdopterin-binding protein [Malaciobacter halophilus]AXH09282.1 molybdopterin-binding protein, CinA family [Malaciobacter halophilus]